MIPTRRKFLQLVGQAGGTAAVLATMKEMGLLEPATAADRPKLSAESGKGVSIAILGAGIAGMTAAYELSKAGYSCKILEARDRAGGRCWTLRGGDLVTEMGHQQICPFDCTEDLYLNPGPARIPYHHTVILSYCKKFGIPLEILVNNNRATYFQDDNAFDGQSLLNRRVASDSRGYIAELLAKALSRNALDQELSAEDRERLLEMVRRFGNLDQGDRYREGSRGGYASPPGAGLAAGDFYPSLELHELLKADFWQYKLDYFEGYQQAATMLHPVGGMDRIANAFEQHVGHLIEFNAQVQQIRKTGQGVRIVYIDETGSETSINADYAICTFPLSVLAGIQADFTPAFGQAIAECQGNYVNAIKVGFQATRRFWEEDYQIYGGISWTSREITQMWYPSTNYHAQTGIILGAYIWSNAIAEKWEKMTPAQRLAEAIEGGEAIHPGYRREVSSAKGMSIAWGKIPYSQGAWAQWAEKQRETVYETLIEPDGPIYLAGEHLSYLNGWQEGAARSALLAVEKIAQHVQLG